MTINEHLTRARNLLAAGRFQRQHLKTIEHYEKINAQDSIVEGVSYTPYFDETTKQVTFVAHKNNGHSYELLVFSAFDYHYGAKDGFVWADKDEE